MRIAGWDVIVFDEIDSTNAEAKRRARAGFAGNVLLIAETQTAGRGRMDRKWESPRGAGLWMTQLFRAPNRSPEGAVFVSALALVRALRVETGGDFLIKWPNDIVINGKKVCGMLAECGFDADGAWIALGSGLNLRAGALELPHAISVEQATGRLIARDEILPAYLTEFNTLRGAWAADGLATIIEQLRPLSATLGCEVLVSGERAQAVDIDIDGALIIMKDNRQRRVVAGDVSVRGLAGYV